MSGVLTVPGAVLRPTRPGEKGPFAQVCGVFGPDGLPIASAQTTSRVGGLCLPCRFPGADPTPLPQRPGRWLFGGIGFHHFGHALIFSTSRLWALDHMAKPPDGILFLDRGTEGKTRPGTTRNLQNLLQLLGITLPVWTVGRDEQVEQLIVPDEGISTNINLFDGTEDYRRFIRRRLGDVGETASHPAVYVSRTGLGVHRAGLMFEDRIEAQLAAAGYHIFQPERASLATQIATYRGASRIIGIDGSAMHLVAFAAMPATKVAVLGRRPFYADAMASQTRAFSGAVTTALHHYTTVLVGAEHAKAPDPWLYAHGLPDFPALGRSLMAAGFLAEGQGDWQAPDAQAIRQRTDQIERRSRCLLVPLGY
jgi:Glycosyltransferase 61